MSDPALHPFEQTSGKQFIDPSWRRGRLFVAVSGGPDSVALLRAMHALNPAEVVIGHFNHRWRGAASDQNEQFVETLGAQQGLRVLVERSSSDDRTEESARAERYAFFERAAAALQANYVLLGHTANDQAETILHRILRGTALRGLAGIPMQRPLGRSTIYRPILWAGRRDVLEYLQDCRQAYCVDESNTDTSYTRNRIRHNLLPHLEAIYNPAVVQSLLRLGGVAQESHEYMQRQATEAMSKTVSFESPDTVTIRRDQFRSLPDVIQKTLLQIIWQRQAWPEKSMGYAQWVQLAKAIEEEKNHHLPQGIRLESSRNVTRLRKHHG